MSRSFDGVDDVINCGSSTSLDDLGPLSIGAWINIISAGENGFGAIWLKGDSSDSAGSKYFANSGVGQLAILFWITKAAGDQLQRTASTQLNASTWTFVHMTWDGSNDFNNIHIYYNLSEVSYASASNASSIPSDAAFNLGIGNDPASGTQTFDGSIAHVQTWNRVLSVNEMAQAMRFPGSITRGLIGFWPLWGGSPEPDYSGKGNSGTVTGALVSNINPPINRVFGYKRPRLKYYSSTAVVSASLNTKISVLGSTKVSTLLSTKLKVLNT